MKCCELLPTTWGRSGLTNVSPHFNDFAIATNSSNAKSDETIWVASVFDILSSISPVGILSNEEMKKANSFRNQRRCENFFASRILLRHALSWSVAEQVTPNQWTFQNDAYGKPQLWGDQPNFGFSISYSNGFIAVGICTYAPIGIDIELYSNIVTSPVTTDVLTYKELRLLNNTSAAEKEIVSTKLWAGKEAISKAVGYGSAIDFGRIDVSLCPASAVISPTVQLPIFPCDLSICTLEFNNRSICLAIAKRTKSE